MTVDYGRTEAGTPSGGNQVQGTNFGIGSQITIPNGRQVTSFSFYAHSADATTKYRPYGYLRSGSMTGTGSNLIAAAEQTGFSIGLNTISLSTSYTNTSGASQEIYFGINIIVSTIDKYIWSGANIEQPYFANGGSDTPPGTAPAFTSNSGKQAHFVSGPDPAVAYTWAIGVGSFTLTGQSITIANSRPDFVLGAGAFVVMAPDPAFVRATLMALGVGAFTLTGIGLVKATSIAIETGAFVLTGGKLVFFKDKFYSHPAAAGFVLPPRLQQLTVNPPVLIQERQK